MPKPIIRIVTVECRGGCGKQISTTNRSLYGLEELHKKYAGYCANCLPISERELLLLQGRGIAAQASTGDIG